MFLTRLNRSSTVPPQIARWQHNPHAAGLRVQQFNSSTTASTDLSSSRWTSRTANLKIKRGTRLSSLTSALPMGIRRCMTTMRVSALPISDESKSSIQRLFLTRTQVATLKAALNGEHILTQIKNSSGKEITFVLPAIEQLHRQGSRPQQISVLIITPKSELAAKIAAQANMLLESHPFKLHCAFAGTPISEQATRLRKEQCDILIATPLRLFDLLQNHGIQSHLSNLKILILDEAEWLLDRGFKPVLEKIMSCLPDATRIPRQTWLFSPTLGSEVTRFAAKNIGNRFSLISPLRDEGVEPRAVRQTSVLLPLSDHLPAMLALLRKDYKAHFDPNSKRSTSKCMIFVRNMREAILVADALKRLPDLPPIYEYERNKSHGPRMQVISSFKDAKSGIFLCSNSTPDGITFPGVTLMLHIGMSASTDKYIQRLESVARANFQTHSILMLSHDEKIYLDMLEMEEQPITTVNPNTFPEHGAAGAELTTALRKVGKDVKATTYRGWLMFYRLHMTSLGWDDARFVQEGETFARSIGWCEEQLPEMTPGMIAALKLNGLPGVNVKSRIEKGKRSRANKPARNEKRASPFIKSK